MENKRYTLYEKVAEDISHLVNQGTFRVGDRIPSVRKLSQQMNISITTVLEAYRLLEDRGLIECRPQSGYYVRPSFGNITSEPAISKPSAKPTKVNINELAMLVLKNTRNPDLIQLGAAIPNPELLPVDRINRTLSAITRRYRIQNISYEFTPGSKALRVQIARRALTSGCSLTPDDIIITSGCQEAIMLALRVICRQGDTVAIESPTYYNFLQAIEILGLRALEIPTHPQHGVSIDALRYAIEHNAIRACLFIPNFHNPLGSCMPDEKKKELVEMLSEYDIPLIEDDIYGDISFSYQRPKAAKAFDKKGNVILCSSFSKTVAPGYRVGWIVPGRFRAEIERLKSISSIATATPTQLAIAEFLANEGYDHHLRKIRKMYAKNTVSMAEAVSRLFPEGTKVTRPAGGHVLWVELPKCLDSLKLYEIALNAGITIAPGMIFSSQQRYRNFIRLNAAMWNDKIKEAIATLGRLVKGVTLQQ